MKNSRNQIVRKQGSVIALWVRVFKHSFFGKVILRNMLRVVLYLCKFIFKTPIFSCSFETSRHKKIKVS